MRAYNWVKETKRQRDKERLEFYIRDHWQKDFPKHYSKINKQLCEQLPEHLPGQHVQAIIDTKSIKIRLNCWHQSEEMDLCKAVDTKERKMHNMSNSTRKSQDFRIQN